MNGYWAMVRKEVVHLLRDRTTIFMALMLPIFQLCMYGYAIDFDVRHIPTVVVDHDRTRESRELIDRLRATQYLDPDLRADGEDDAAEMIRTGRVQVAVLVPPDFTRRLIAKQSPTIGVLLDGSDSQIAMRARSAFMTAGVSADAVQTRISVLFNPTMRTANFMVPGIIGLLLQVVLVILTSGSIVREREQGSMEQLMVSPIGRTALMLGKLTPFMGLALLEMLGILFFGWLLFDVHIAGSFILLMLLSLPFVFASLALGLLISTVAQSQNQAQQMSFMVMLPSILLSGFIFPRDTMPGVLYVFSELMPLTHELQILRGVVVRGAGFGELWQPFVIVLGLSALLVTLAARKFQKNLG